MYISKIISTQVFKNREPCLLDFPGSAVVENPPRQCRRRGFDPWVGKILCRRAWQPTLVFLPGKFHGQRSLAGYSLWGCRIRYDLATEHTLSEIIKSSLALLDLSYIPFVSHSLIESTFNVPDTALGTWDEQQQQRVLLSRR